MADRSRSPSAARSDSNMPTNQTRGRPKGRGQLSKASKTALSKESSRPTSDREALRRDKALEKEFAKAQKRAHNTREVSPSSSVGSTGPSVRTTAQVHHWSPSVSPVPLERPIRPDSDQGNSPDNLTRAPKKSRPSATFTPTAAGLRQDEPVVSLSKEVQELISRSIAQSIDSALLDRGVGTSRPHSFKPGLDQVSRRHHQGSDRPTHGQRDQSHRSTSPSNHSDISFMACPDEFGYTFSEDEDGPSDTPASASLFKSEQFKTLLKKAKAAANLGASSASSEGPSHALDPVRLLFTEPVTDQEVVPSPKLFTDLVQRQWLQPGSVASPSHLDKKLFTVEKHFEEMLDIPKVEAPVASLASPSVLPSDSADGLRPEDRRAEMANRKTHMATSWAIRSATSASFFARTSLIWLRQIQQRADPEDARTHQDLLKLISAAEYLADATLASAKFASRALASNIASRRLLWIKNWQADMKAKWKLTSAPFKGTDLFGETLTAALIEDKDKRKVLPQVQRRTDRRSANTPYRRPTYRSQDYSFRSSYQSRPFQHSWDRSSDRQSFRDRGRSSQSKRPFRGAGFKSYRRGK